MDADDITLAQPSRDKAARFAELYQQYFLGVYRYAWALTGDEAAAQDLTSRTFLAALEGIASYRGSGSFVAWLFGIARRQAALAYRSRRREVSLEQASELADPAPSPEAQASERLDQAKALQALQQITPQRAEALALVIFGGLTAREAGESLGKSEAAVKMLVMRGIRELRDRLASPPEGEARQPIPVKK